MANVHRLPLSRDARREASEWIARLHAADVTVEDRARFEHWRSAHPLHARAYEELSVTWQRFAAAGPFVRAVWFAQSLNESAGMRRTRRWAMAAVATCAAAALVAVLYAARVASVNRFSTAVGEQATISLSDGSTMELNSDSLVDVDYAPGSRVIRLKRGEAFFKVAHDLNRPFWVVSGRSWVRAVGTAFNVYVRSTEVQVTVSEGTVKIGSAEPSVSATPSDAALTRVNTSVLTAGQQAELRDSTTTTRRLSSTELARFVAWREGTLDFEGRALGDVVDELNRYTPVRLVINDEKLRQLPVGGTFQASPQGADALLLLLEQGFGLHVRRQGDRAFIESKAD